MQNELAPIEIPHGAVAGFRDVDSSRGSYVTFPMPGKGAWDKIKQKFSSLEPFEPILVRQNRLGDEYVRVADDENAFRCFFLGGFHCFAELDISSGSPVRASLTEIEGLVELVEAVVIVETDEDNEFELTRVSFRRGLAKAGLQMYNAQTVTAVDPEWVTTYPHVAKVPPQFRHCHHIPVTVRASRRNAGLTYPVADASCEPVTPQQLAGLQKYLESPAFKENQPLVLNRYRARIAEIQAKIPA